MQIATLPITDDRATGPADRVAALGSILGVWAHPDDEAYLSAGLMALATAGGQRVVVVTATAGDQGTDDPRRWPPARLAPRRRRELAAALAEVGVDEHHLLGYGDGTCAAAPVGPAAGRVAAVVDAVRPDTIVTFGPDGITGHPDHIAVSGWVDLARELVGGSVRVLHATTTSAFADRFADVHQRLGVFPEDLPLRTPAHALALELALPPEVLDRKVAALRAHASQTTGLIEAMGAETYRAWWSTEAFVAG